MKALIIGIDSQDGYYLSKLLLENGYEVHGTTRRVHENIDSNVTLHYLNLQNPDSFPYIFLTVHPQEIYNLASISSVSQSFREPKLVSKVNGFSVLDMLETIKYTNTRFYQSSTSELFGLAEDCPQTEKTKFHPRSPYAVAKLYAHSMVVNYREAYNLHASNGILYNHFSVKRGENFVERKITKTIAKIKLGLEDCLYLGNIYSMRDWGNAEDFVKAMWLMLQQPKANDYIISTGITHSIKDFVNICFDCAGMKISWEGEGLNEVAICGKEIVVRIDQDLYRPSDVDYMLGDSMKASIVLGWEPETCFENLISDIYKHDYNMLMSR